MADQTEKVTTIFAADSSGLDTALRKVGANFDEFTRRNRNVTSSAEDLTSKFTGLDRAGVRLGGSLRGVSEFFKASSLGKISAAAGFIGGVATVAFEKFGAEAEEAARKLAEFDEQFRKTSRSNTFANSAQGSGSLVSRLLGNRDEQRQLRELVSENSPTDTLGKVKQKVGDWLQFGTNADDMRALRNQGLSSQSRLGGQQEAKLQTELNKSLASELSIVRAITSGRTDQAKWDELELQRRREITSLEEAGLLTAARRNSVNDKYAEFQTKISIDRMRAEIYSNAELSIVEKMSRGQTDLAAQEKLRLDYSKQYEALKLSGGTDEQLTAETKKFEFQKKMLLTEQQYNLLHHASAMQIAKIEGSNLSTQMRAIAVEETKLRAIREELRGREGITKERERELQLAEKASETAIKRARQDRDFELRNKPGTRNARDAQERRDQTERDKFDKRQMETGGLTSIHRDMAGNPVSGINPATGKREPISGYSNANAAGNSVMIGDQAPGGSPGDRIRAGWGWNPRGTLDGGSSTSDIRSKWNWPGEGGMNAAIRNGWGGKWSDGMSPGAAAMSQRDPDIRQQMGWEVKRTDGQESPTAILSRIEQDGVKIR